MTTIDFITDLFCRIDDRMRALPKHPQAVLWPSEIVTLRVLHALKGVGNRAFYRWVTRDYRPSLPRLPERTRLFRQFETHQRWALPSWRRLPCWGRGQPRDRTDPSGSEGRSPAQVGRKGLSNHRWIVGVKLGLLANRWGEIVGWMGMPANAHDTWFHPLVRLFQQRMVVLADTGFHARVGDPPNLKLCPRGTWQ